MLRRLLAIVVLAFAPYVGTAHAQECDSQCARYVRGVIAQWVHAQQVTLERQWYGLVISQLPQARCVSHHESRGSYVAENAHSTASGKYQFLRGTGDNVNRARGHYELVGLPAADWPWWEQEAAFLWAWEHLGPSPWTGTGCT